MGEYVAIDELLDTDASGGLDTIDDDGSWFTEFDRDYIEGQRSSYRILQWLHRLGADPVQATAFQQQGFTLARHLGDCHDLLARWTRAAQYNLGNREYTFQSQVPRGVSANEIKQALRPLRDAEILAKAPRVFPVKSRGKNKRGGLRVETTVDPSSRQAISMLRDHWLSAYARWVIQDHADRNGIDNETVSMLRARMPREVVGRRELEFDVVSYFPAPAMNLLLWVECKAGSVANIEPIEFVKYQTALRAAVDVVGDEAPEVRGVCLIPRPVSRRDLEAVPELESALSEHGILLWAIPELRKFVHTLF